MSDEMIGWVEAVAEKIGNRLSYDAAMDRAWDLVAYFDVPAEYQEAVAEGAVKYLRDGDL